MTGMPSWTTVPRPEAPYTTLLTVCLITGACWGIGTLFIGWILFIATISCETIDGCDVAMAPTNGCDWKAEGGTIAIDPALAILGCWLNIPN